MRDEQGEHPMTQPATTEEIKAKLADWEATFRHELKYLKERASGGGLLHSGRTRLENLCRLFGEPVPPINALDLDRFSRYVEDCHERMRELEIARDTALAENAALKAKVEELERGLRQCCVAVCGGTTGDDATDQRCIGEALAIDPGNAAAYVNDRAADFEIAIAQAELTWTTELPNREGWWWWSTGDAQDRPSIRYIEMQAPLRPLCNRVPAGHVGGLWSSSPVPEPKE